jgi:UAA transporter family
VLFCTVQLLLYDFHHLIGYVIFLTSVLVGNTRKAMTIVLSFILFPKPYNWMYGAGGVLVFGSLIGNALMKEKSSKMSGGGGKKDGGIISGV